MKTCSCKFEPLLLCQYKIWQQKKHYNKEGSDECVCVGMGGGGWGACRPTHLPMQQLPPAALRLRWITEGREQEMMRRGRETRVHQPIKLKRGHSSVQTGGLQINVSVNKKKVELCLPCKKKIEDTAETLEMLQRLAPCPALNSRISAE